MNLIDVDELARVRVSALVHRGIAAGQHANTPTRQHALPRLIFFWLLVAGCVSLVTGHLSTEAAIAKGTKQQLQSGETNQGGGTTSSSRFLGRSTIGDALSGNRMTSVRFQITPGFLAAALSDETSPRMAGLILEVLYAKEDPLGPEIPAKTWQKSRTPIFFWQPPTFGLQLAGYSYAIDADPDDKLDTTDIFYDVSKGLMEALTDGKHTFSVKALNTAGTAGKPISLEIWVDATPPQVTTYSPSPGTLLNTLNPTVSATVTDVLSGLDTLGASFSVNGVPASIIFNDQTNELSATGGVWKEGVNSLELRVSDLAGNAQSPLVWSVTMDTQPPTGTVTIKGGAEMTTSAYVTLGLNATDVTSGVVRVLISNDEQSGYVEEAYVALRELWKLTPVRGKQTVYVKFIDKAGNVSRPVFASIDLELLAPETLITSGPAGFTPATGATLTFACPEGDCVFSYAFDNEEWSPWSPVASATKANLALGNHYFRIKAAKEVNGQPDIQIDEEDPSPAERTWVVGVEPSVFSVPKGPPIKVWRIE